MFDFLEEYNMLAMKFISNGATYKVWQDCNNEKMFITRNGKRIWTHYFGGMACGEEYEELFKISELLGANPKVLFNELVNWTYDQILEDYKEEIEERGIEKLNNLLPYLGK